jgi:Na+/proline symporter
MSHQDFGTPDSDVSMQAIVQVLETPPAVAIAPDFAARVMQRVPARRRRSALSRARALSPRYGTATALLAAVALVIALVTLPFHSSSPTMQAGTQVLLLVDLFSIGLWLFVLRWRAQ